MKDSQTITQTEDGRLHYHMAETGNPCFGCAGCCRYFRVSFYHGEVDSQPGGYVPAELTVPVTPFLVAMKGTEAGHQPCVALGDDYRCRIYAQRPSTCREFPAYLPDGTVNPECQRLQAILGVKGSEATRLEASPLMDPEHLELTPKEPGAR